MDAFELLKGVSGAEFNELGRKALARAVGRGQLQFAPSAFVPLIVEQLAWRSQVQREAVTGEGRFYDARKGRQILPLVEFVWWLVRAGLAFPAGQDTDDSLPVFGLHDCRSQLGDRCRRSSAHHRCDRTRVRSMHRPAGQRRSGV